MTSFKPRNFLAMGLIAGIKPEHLKWTEEESIKAAAKEQDILLNLNITMHSYMIDPTQPISKHVAEVKAILDSKPFDGVSIGFGVRGSEPFTDLFTALVNLIVEEGKNQEGKPPKLLFALGPDALVAAVQSVWPEYA